MVNEKFGTCEVWIIQGACGVSDEAHILSTVSIVSYEIWAPTASRFNLARGSQGLDTGDDTSRGAEAFESDDIGCKAGDCGE